MYLEFSQFAKQINDNLNKWVEKHCALVKKAKSQEGASSPRTTTQPEDFLSAFPPTLPRSFLSDHERRTSSDFGSEFFSSSSGSRPPSVASGASHYETCTSSSPSSPSSPLREETVTVPPSLPRLEITTSSTSSHGRAPSINSAASAASATSSCFINPSHATNVIRQAYNASVRKKKSFHRTSWNPTPAEFAEMTSRHPLPASPTTSSPFLSNTSPLSPPSAASSASPLTPGSVRSLRSTSNTLLKALCDPIPPA